MKKYFTSNFKFQKESLVSRVIQFVASVIFVAVYSDPALALKAIEKHGITWTFSKDIPEGQYGYFANGDPWVVGPVTITHISPETAEGINGSMINPVPDGQQGFDTRIPGNLPYSSEVNIAEQLPYVVQPGTSVLSSVGLEVTDTYKYVQQIDILTVLSSPASPGDFRPPYIGSDKSLNWNESQIDYGKLGAFSVPSGAEKVPAVEDLEAYYEYPWVELYTGWSQRYLLPTRNFPMRGYGREIAHAAGLSLLWLQLDKSTAEKRTLTIKLIQAGIDLYASNALGAKWYADGGINLGRKMVVLFAGAMLDDANILVYADAKKNLIYQEDQQTFVVTQTEVDITHSDKWDPDDRSPITPYTEADIGTAEWGIRHSYRPNLDNQYWGAKYRHVNGGAMFSNFAVAKLMGLEERWNWPPFFAYHERYFDIEWPLGTGATTSAPNAIHPFAAAMYIAHGQSGEPAPIESTPEESTPEESTPEESTPEESTPEEPVPVKTKLEKPLSSIVSGIYLTPQLVSFSSSEESSIIHYTTDGSTPTSSSKVYTAPFSIESDTTVSSIALKDGFEQSSVGSVLIQIVEEGSSREVHSDSDWGTIFIPEQKENFSISFDMKAGSDGINGVVGLTDVLAGDWRDLAAIIRFHDDGYVDVRNGSVYEKELEALYVANEKVKVMVNVNLEEEVYEVYVSLSENQPVVLLASGYSFRTEKAGTKSITGIGFNTMNEQSHSISNIRLFSYEKSPPKKPNTVEVKVIKS